jgi:hypothetical protein
MASGQATTDAPLIGRARSGIRNLVRQVADVQPGERVLILSEYGRVEKELPNLIGEVVKEAGGECHVMWADPLEPGVDSPPTVLMAAMLTADKLIYNVPAGTPGQMPIAPVRYLEKDKGPSE